MEKYHLRIKIYVFILFLAYCMGGLEVSGPYKHGACGLVLTIGFGITLIYDLIIYFGNRKKQ